MVTRSRRFGKRIFIAAIIIALLSAGALYLSNSYYEPEFVHYKEFGIDIPAKYSVHGIDVSRYQQQISWKAVREMRVKNISLQFAFIKATEGTDMVDAQFRRNMPAAARAGSNAAHIIFLSAR